MISAIPRWIVAILAIGALLGTGTYAFLRALRHVPTFYAEAIAISPAAYRADSGQMLRRTAALASNVQKTGRWQATFTVSEINGWLAVDLEENHSYALAPGVEKPRVRIQANELVLACRYSSSLYSGIVSLTLEPYLDRPNVVAVRIRKARAGRLPLPLQSFLNAATTALPQSDFRLEWRQADGDPVALITLPSTRRSTDKPVTLEAFEVLDGKIHLAGSTGSRQ